MARLANDFVERLAIAARLDAKHHPPLRRHERHLLGHVAGDHALADLKAGRDVGGEDEDGVGGQERFRERQAAVGAVVEGSFEPLAGGGVGGVAGQGNDESGQGIDPFRSHRVPFVGHGTRPDLLGLERLEEFTLVLQQPKVGGHLRGRLVDSGKINHGDTVVFGNFSQDGLIYKEDKRAIEYVKDMAEYFPLNDGTKISASQFMEKFGFSAEQQFTPLSKLSGGEKRRLHLMSVLFLNPNFLVLDEPTNDLDLQTLRTLEEFLMEYPGCILIVSHDRYFMDRMVDHLFAFEGNAVIRDYPGNYTQYREAIANGSLTDERQIMKQEQKIAEPAPVINSNSPVQKLSFKEKRELELLDKEMPELQKEKAALETTMNEGNPGFNELQKAAERIGIIVQLMDEKEMRWLELSEKN